MNKTIHLLLNISGEELADESFIDGFLLPDHSPDTNLQRLRVAAKISLALINLRVTNPRLILWINDDNPADLATAISVIHNFADKLSSAYVVFPKTGEHICLFSMQEKVEIFRGYTCPITKDGEEYIIFVPSELPHPTPWLAERIRKSEFGHRNPGTHRQLFPLITPDVCAKITKPSGEVKTYLLSGKRDVIFRELSGGLIRGD
jgi:hypothetical protein